MAWQLYWPSWYKLWPVYYTIEDTDLSLETRVLCIGPLQMM